MADKRKESNFSRIYDAATGYSSADDEYIATDIQAYAKAELEKYLTHASWDYLHRQYPKKSGESKGDYYTRSHELHESKAFQEEFSEWVKEQPKYKMYTEGDPSENENIVEDYLEKNDIRAQQNNRAYENQLRGYYQQSAGKRQKSREKLISRRVEDFVDYLVSKRTDLIGLAHEIMEDALYALRASFLTDRLFQDTDEHYGIVSEEVTADTVGLLFDSDSFNSNALQFILDFCEDRIDPLDRALSYLKKTDPDGFKEAMDTAVDGLSEEEADFFLKKLYEDVYGDESTEDAIFGPFIGRYGALLPSVAISVDEAKELVRRNPHYAKGLEERELKAQQDRQKERRGFRVIRQEY